MEHSEEQSYEERQQDELEFLQFVFMSDFEDLRKKDSWKIRRPPEILITLVPQKSISTSVRQRLQVSVKLHAKYSADYPDNPPELNLLEPNLLSEDFVKELLKEINDLAKERVGEVMMLEIAQHVQAFLHKHDRPPVSLYDEMVKRREKEAEEENLKRFQELEVKRLQQEEEMAQEIQRRQAQLKEKVQLSEESSESGDSSDDLHSTRLSATAMSGGDPSTCDQQEKKDLNILKGKQIGESLQGSYSIYNGMDLDSGEQVVIYEWTLPCKPSKKGDTRRVRQVTSIRQEYDSFVEKYIGHCSLVKYLLMRHQVTEQGIVVEVVMEYVSGGNLTRMLRNSNMGPLSVQTLRYYSKQLVEAVEYLHSQGIVHNDIRPSLVFVDAVNGAKLAGFTIIKRLTDLSGKTTDETWPPGFYDSRGGKKTDILKLGMVILCMAMGRINVSYPPADIPDHFNEHLKDFLSKCLNPNEYQRYPAHELLVHPFITPSFVTSAIDVMKTAAINPSPLAKEGTSLSVYSQRVDGSLASSCDVRSTSVSSSQSRLEMEFEELEVLGKGGFGDVIKVRNYLDGRLYAIKKVKLSGGSKMMAKVTREVELLSQMNHENVVRYYNAWIETLSEENYQFSNQSDEEDMSEEDEEEFSGSSESEEESTDDDEREEEGLSFIEFESNISIKPSATQSDEESTSIENSEVFTDTTPNMDIELFDTKPGVNVGTLLEADVMGMTPRRLLRSGTESSEGVIFQESSSVAAQTNPAAPISEREDEEESPRKSKQRNSGQIRFLYIQMEYCANQTLRQLIDSGQLQKDPNFSLGWQLFREITEGLAHIHAQGMIHRDLKPGNIFLNSSGHIKIGDFGLATTFNKHPVLSRHASFAEHTSILAGDTGLVGTTMYLAPELFKPVVKYTQKVDIYSLGIIFYEMSHVPVSTLMERAKILSDIRKKEINFSDSFNLKKMSNQATVIKWLLNHTPSDRPTSIELLNSSYIPYQIEEEQLQEVIVHTLQNPNSSRHRRLMEKLFSQANTKFVEVSFFPEHYSLESEKSKSFFNVTISLLQQFVWSITENIFNKHCGWYIQVPLLEPSNELVAVEGCVHLLEPTGKLLCLPHDHWVSFARYILQHDITSLKRYDLFKAYQCPRIPGTHPKESRHFVFDVVSPASNRLIHDAEVVSIVSEIISDLQLSQVCIKVNHTALLSAILTFCSVSQDQQEPILKYLYKISIGKLKLSELESLLKDNLHLQLTPLALKSLIRYISSQTPLEEAQSLLEPLVKNKATASLVKRVLQDLKLFGEQLEQLKVQEKVLLCPGLKFYQSYFQGLIFQFSLLDSTGPRQGKKKRHTPPLAIGGRYSKLLERLKTTGHYSQANSSTSTCVCGISIDEDAIVKELQKAYVNGQCPLPMSISKCQGLVCSLSSETPLHDECTKLVRELRDKGVAVDHLYEPMDLENIQELCYKRHIPYIIILEKALLIRKQVKVKSLDVDKERIISERIANVSELIDYISPRHSIEKSDSTEGTQQPTASRTSSSAVNQDTHSLPPVAITTVGRQKLQGNLRRRMDSQTLSKLLPLLQKFPAKSPIEIIAIDFELDPLCLLAVEMNKAISQGRSDHAPIIKLLTERDQSLGKKYVSQVCESIQDKISKKAPVIFLYSYVVEQCQIVLNNSFIV